MTESMDLEARRLAALAEEIKAKKKANDQRRAARRQFLDRYLEKQVGKFVLATAAKKSEREFRVWLLREMEPRIKQTAGAVERLRKRAAPAPAKKIKKSG